MRLFDPCKISKAPKRFGYLRRVCTFGQRPLFRKMIDDLSRGFLADKWREFFDTCFRNFVNRSEVTQQSCLALLAHAGNRRELGSEVTQLAPLAVIGHSVAMRLITN